MKFDFKLFGIRFLVVDIYKFERYTSLIVQNQCSRKINNQNVADIKGWLGNEYIERFREFLIKKNIGRYLYQDGKVVARAWAFIYNNKSRMYKYLISEIMVRIGYVEVMKAYRKHGLSNILLNDLVLDCINNGYRNIYIDISSTNLKMLKTVKKCGFIYCASAFVVQIKSRNVIEIKLNQTRL